MTQLTLGADDGLGAEHERDPDAAGAAPGRRGRAAGHGGAPGPVGQQRGAGGDRGRAGRRPVQGAGHPVGEQAAGAAGPQAGGPVHRHRDARRHRAGGPAARRRAGRGRPGRIGTGTTGPGAALWVDGTVIESPPPSGRAQELAKEYKGLVGAILQKRGAWQVVDVVQQIDDPSTLADNAGYAPYLSLEQKIEVLETPDVVERLNLVIGWARDHLAELDVAETIRKDVQEGMEKTQREFLLRQQQEAIRKELAELTGEPAGEEDDYRARIEAADLPEKVREAALKEVDKLERASDASPESGWIRTWLDTVLDIPWNERTEDAYDIAGAREVLDADHAGLDDVKERIIEYLAVRKRREERGLGVVGGRRSGAVLAL